MTKSSQSLDGFFLTHSRQRAEGVLRSARIGVKNLAEEFSTLAERTPIPEELRDRYAYVAESLLPLVAALREAEQLAARTLLQAEREWPIPLPSTATPGPVTQEAVLRVGKALNAAEAKAREILQQTHPDLAASPWSRDNVHAEARWVLLLDPGPDFQHYLLEDTDFNLFEEPSSALSGWGKNEPSSKDWLLEPSPDSGPLAALDGHGQWLHDLLARSCLGWEHLPMVRTVYVDFDFGTGLEVVVPLERPS